MAETMTDLVPSKLPPLFRVTSIARLPAPKGVLTQANLYHDAACLRVAWVCRQPDIRIVAGSLVSIRWQGNPVSEEGCVRIGRLVLLERVEPEVDLFRTVPPAWVRDRMLVQRASTLWQSLPRSFRHLFNALLWDGRRFQRFLMGPSSLENHHNRPNGNFAHSVEVAERAMALAREHPPASAPLAVLAGLIHDLGKADEYRFDRLRQRFSISPEGELVGHRDRLQQWIAAAIARHRVILPQEQLLGLIHALTAAKGAPPYLGLREPKSLEASILSMADRLSGESDLHRQLSPPEGGFGRFHRHLKGRPYVTPTIAA
jgi:3'-5' exoribonuclease